MAIEVRQLLQDLPVEGNKRLLDLLRQLPPSQMVRADSLHTPIEQLRALIVRLAENWSRFRVFGWQKDVPWTNNPTHHVIGKMKMRTRTLRGY